MELEAGLSRPKRELAEARMERDILKKPPRTLRRYSCPVRVHEDAACPLSAESVVPGAGGVPKWELSRSPLKVSEQPHGDGYAAFFVDAGCGSACSASILAMTGAISA